MFCIVSVLDVKAGSYGQPVMVRSLALAERSFSDEANRNHPDNAVFNHPEDFSLYHCGTFDEDTGIIEAANPPVRISNAADLKKSV